MARWGDTITPMQALWRIIFGGLAAISALLGAVTIGAVGCSFWRGYGAQLTRIVPTSNESTKTETSFFLGRGGVYFFRDYNYSPGDFSWFHPKSPEIRYFVTEARYPGGTRLGFGQTRFSNTGPLGVHCYVGMAAPVSVIGPILLIPGGWWFCTRGPRRPSGNKGFCPRCNYDLRATPERCPECGTVPSNYRQRHLCRRGGQATSAERHDSLPAAPKR
jgi:hypothetical protein